MSALKSKIDTHQHFLPKVYVDAVGTSALARVMPNGKAPEWSPNAALAMMEAHGIAEGILSISCGPELPDAPTLLRKCNDYAADLRSRYQGHFGSFASLPLPDVDASLKELAHSLDTLKADGCILFTNYDGRYLGDPLFDPLLEELNRRKAVAFVHPCEPGYQLAHLPPASVLEFPFDTTRTAASLIFSGALRRYPDIRFILSHAGGALPFLATRLAGAAQMNPALAEKIGDVPAAIRYFYFDTALSVSPPALAALVLVADPARILFGSDFPMAPSFAIAQYEPGLQRAPIGEEIRNGIFRNNAARLLGRTQTA